MIEKSKSRLSFISIENNCEWSRSFQINNFLLQVSPAIITRCGMIYMSPDSLGWITLVEAWIGSNQEEWWYEHETLLIGLFKWALIPCIQFIERNTKKVVNVGTANIVR
jgi:dynein heavy chain